MMIIGITGSFGSGKTTVARMFAEQGGFVIDADEVYHSLIKPGKICHKKIVQNFGKGILTKNGRIDRKKLGQIVFRQKSKLKLLDSLVHPEITRKIEEIIIDIVGKPGRLIIIDAAVLVESGFYKKADKIIVVKNKIKEQVKRLKRAKGLTEKDIIRRIRMQMSLRKKLVFADFIIDNSGSKTKTLSQVKRIWANVMG